MTRAYKWTWNARIEKQTLSDLQEISEELGFLVDTPGTYHGNPSPPALLDALATAYRDDPATAIEALRSLGVVGEAESQAK